MTADPNTMPIGTACTEPNGAACAGPIATVDWRTGGEPFRIVPKPPSHPGDARLSGVYGTVFTEEAAAPVERSATVQGRPAVAPAVTGTAYATGASRFTVDPDDTLVPGFVPR
ncbi:proline racemase family protein [Streptomyces sp. NPDC017546]|uniref:proline racemase family protein n=1 Tax=unclassified Streptomyces TaxID=2593676 RepID=UPI0023624D0C|nr:proline racemase family protein [Streptomyces sp. MMBL 11-1]